MSKLKGVIYTRVSTDKQEYDRQIAELKEYADKNNIDIIRIYEEKISGLKSDRPQYLELKKLTKEDIDIILVWELSRLSRKRGDILNTIDDFTKKGINVYIKNMDILTLDPDGKLNGAANILLGILSTFAENEITLMKQRVIASKRDYVINKGHSHTSLAPYGYNITNKILKIDPEEAEIVKKIFDLNNNGYSTYSIVNYLNSEGYTLKNGNKFTQAIILYLLKNPIYKGEIIYNSNKKSNKCSEKVSKPELRIIEDSVFEIAQKKLTQKKIIKSSSSLSQKHLLQGLLTCPNCGTKYVFENSKERKRYKCSTAYLKFKLDPKDRSEHKCISFKADAIEEVVYRSNLSKSVLRYIKQESAKKKLDLTDKIKILNDKKSNVEGEINNKTSEIERIAKKLYSSKIDTDLYSLLENMMDEKTVEKEKLRKQLSTINNEIVGLEVKLKNIDNNFTGDISTDRYDFIHQTIENITAYSEGESNSLLVVKLITDRKYYIALNTRKKLYAVLDPVTPEDAECSEFNSKDIKGLDINEYFRNINSYDCITNYFNEEKRTGVINNIEISMNEYIKILLNSPLSKRI